MERITKQLTIVRTSAAALVLIAAIFGVPLVGAQKADSDSSSSDSGRTVIKADKPSDSGDKGDTKPSSGGSSGGGDTKPSSDGDTKPSSAPSSTPSPEGVCSDDMETSIVGADGLPFNGGGPANTNISVAANRATVVVKNISEDEDCIFTLNLASYEIFDVDMNDPQHVETQELFKRQILSIAPGSQQTFRVDLPLTCDYQVDLFAGSYVPQTNPDFGNPPLSNTHTLFDWVGRHNNIPCGEQPEPPTCPSENIKVMIVDGQGNQFGRGLGIPNAPTQISIVNSGTGARVTVKNLSEDCAYKINLASYKTYLGNDDPDYIRTQTIFDSESETIAPQGQFTFNVSLPSCNYQVDLFAGATVPQTNPDFGRVPLSLTHTLFDWTARHDAPCQPQCPVNPPAIFAPTNFVGVVGQQITIPVTITDASGAGITTSGTLPVGLSFEHVGGNNYVISGVTQQTTTGTNFTINASNECGDASVTIRIVINGGACPVPPPIITSPSTASGTVDTLFTYTITTSGPVGEITVGRLPSWLSFNSATNTLSGTPTQAGTHTVILTVTNECGTAVINLTIVVGGDNPQCPIDPPIITSPKTASATVGSSFTYEVEYSGKANITVGQLPSWLSFNASTNTLSGTPTQRGTHTVIITASNQCGAASINLVITVGGGGGSCPVNPPVITSGKTASGKVGDSFSYTITTTGTVDDITVAGLPDGLSLNGNVISGTPTETGTFPAIISAENQCGVATINLVITIEDSGDDDDDGGGGGGGGGGRRRPNVVLFSEPEVLGASISLAQLPYTGLGTSILQIALFILGLLAISGGIIYMIMRRAGGNGDAPTYIAPTDTPRTPVAPTASTVAVEDEMPAEVYEEYARAMTVAAPAVARVAPQARAPQYVPENIPVAPVSHQETRQTSTASVPARTDERALGAREEVSVARIQTEARSARALISDDGAELIAHSAEGDEKKALERMSQIIDIAKTRYPREDGWLILDKDRVRETLFVSTLSMIPLLVEWIVRGEDKKVFTFLRMLKHQEQPVGDFMRKVVSELDTAHRARMEGAEAQAKVNAHIAEVTYHLSNKDLESMIGELLHGVDERYDSAYTSVRLSLVRVLDLIKERAFRSAGAPYAFEGSN